ncbi:MAG: NAD-dependent epimerase/dehydratase family protein [bacterium]|nr:NAD-dependent epimerase/dehydratase family protein [bacterium]
MSNSDKYIVVTGSAGFIGFSLCRELLKRGNKVIGIDNFVPYYSVELKKERIKLLKTYTDFIMVKASLENYKEVEEVFKKYPISRVCNLAAQAGVRHSLSHPFVYEQTNVAGFLTILELVRHYNVPRLVFASSSSVYGGNKDFPFSETQRVDNPISLYAATKKANELMAHSYTHLYGFQTIGLRFFSVYGPWGRPDMALWLFTEAILKNQPIKVFNNGDMRRDFTYVDDIVEGIIGALFAEGLEKNEIFNLGNHKSEDLLKMIEIIEEQLGKKAVKEMLPMQPGDVPDSFAEITKARKKLGYDPKTSINVGIPNFINWYKEQSELTKFIADCR